MRTRTTWAAMGLAACVCLGAGIAAADRPWTQVDRDKAWKSYLHEVETALGTFDDIRVYQEMPDRWKLITGRYIPVTVDDKTPENYRPHMAVDRPMLLPPDILTPGTGEGGGVPYSVVGRMPGSNPEVQWVFLSRHYYVNDPHNVDDTHGCDSFVCLNDIAVIGHHPRTGATAFFQFYDTETPKPAPTIMSPWSAGGQTFWNDVTWVSDINCAKCHSADPFIHSPWISQAKADLTPGEAFPDTIVPSDPLGPYYIVGAEIDGRNIFEGPVYTDAEDKPVNPSWDQYLKHLVAPKNSCTSCHRIPPADNDFAQAVQLYLRSTLGVGAKDYEPDKNQTPAYQALPWMPPVDLAYGDFYGGQQNFYSPGTPAPQVPAKMKEWAAHILKAYEDAVGPDVREVNALTKDDPRLQDVPAPPESRRAIMIDRDQRDTLDPNRPFLVMDMRMRASTDASLSQWRFYAEDGADRDLRATPVVVRRHTSATGTPSFEVRFVGTPRAASDAGKWVPVSGTGDVAIARGDHLALLLSNGGTEPAPALVPYSDDDWARVADADAAHAVPFEIVTYVATLDRMPVPGETVGGEEDGHRTYSFEFRSR